VEAFCLLEVQEDAEGDLSAIALAKGHALRRPCQPNLPRTG